MMSFVDAAKALAKTKPGVFYAGVMLEEGRWHLFFDLNQRGASLFDSAFSLFCDCLSRRCCCNSAKALDAARRTRSQIMRRCSSSTLRLPPLTHFIELREQLLAPSNAFFGFL
jgi:hypothetical protein